ncbi:Protein FDD123 [Rhodotorula toruloides]|nr:Protein FDD123 [Rhodotorula toruloides]
MGNNALNLNPTRANIDITTHASDWLWAVFAIMALSSIAILAWGHLKRPVGERAFHELAAALCFTASIAYFAMASVTRPTRSIWYARYIDWTITTPLLLLELLLVTGLPLSQIFSVLFFDLVMIETGLIGALVASRYKWGFYAFGCAALLYITYFLLVPGRRSSQRLGTDFHKSYSTGALYLSLIWLVYPIIWGVADGGNYITPTSEMVAYGVLDILAKPVFSVVHLMSLSRLDHARLGMSSSKVSDGAHQNLLNEKMGPNSTSATPRASTVASPNAGNYGDGSHFHGGAGTGMGVGNGAGTGTVGDGSHFHRGGNAAAAV